MARNETSSADASSKRWVRQFTQRFQPGRHLASHGQQSFAPYAAGPTQ
ncbi:MAG: hypothetical protein ACXWN0_06495 [Isosphaeraceae bacterium]